MTATVPRAIIFQHGVSCSPSLSYHCSESNSSTILPVPSWEHRRGNKLAGEMLTPHAQSCSPDGAAGMTKERAMAPSYETDDESESAAPWEQPDEATQRAAEPIKQELEQAIAATNTPAKAEALVERLAQDSLGKT